MNADHTFVVIALSIKEILSSCLRWRYKMFKLRCPFEVEIWSLASYCNIHTVIFYLYPVYSVSTVFLEMSALSRPFVCDYNWKHYYNGDSSRYKRGRIYIFHFFNSQRVPIQNDFHREDPQPPEALPQFFYKRIPYLSLLHY